MGLIDAVTDIAQTVLTWLAYNRDTFSDNVQMRQNQMYQEKNYHIQWVSCARDDLRDIMQTSVSKMNCYMVVTTLILSVVAACLIEGQVDEAADQFLKHAYYLHMAVASVYLMLSIVFGVKASNAAFFHSIQLLTKAVTPERTANYDFNYMKQTQQFEKGKLKHIFRIPVVWPRWQVLNDDTVKPRFEQLKPENPHNSAVGIRKIQQRRASVSVPSSGTQEKLEKLVLASTMNEKSDGSLSDPPDAQGTAPTEQGAPAENFDTDYKAKAEFYFEAFNRFALLWAGYEAASEECLALGIVSMAHGAAYYCMGLLAQPRELTISCALALVFTFIAVYVYGNQFYDDDVKTIKAGDHVLLSDHELEVRLALFESKLPQDTRLSEMCGKSLLVMDITKEHLRPIVIVDFNGSRVKFPYHVVVKETEDILTDKERNIEQCVFSDPLYVHIMISLQVFPPFCCVMATASRMLRSRCDEWVAPVAWILCFLGHVLAVMMLLAWEKDKVLATTMSDARNFPQGAAEVLRSPASQVTQSQDNSFRSHATATPLTSASQRPGPNGQSSRAARPRRRSNSRPRNVSWTSNSSSKSKHYDDIEDVPALEFTTPGVTRPTTTGQEDEARMRKIVIQQDDKLHRNFKLTQKAMATAHFLVLVVWVIMLLESVCVALDVGWVSADEYYRQCEDTTSKIRRMAAPAGVALLGHDQALTRATLTQLQVSWPNHYFRPKALVHLNGRTFVANEYLVYELRPGEQVWRAIPVSCSIDDPIEDVAAICSPEQGCRPLVLTAATDVGVQYVVDCADGRTWRLLQKSRTTAAHRLLVEPRPTGDGFSLWVQLEDRLVEHTFSLQRGGLLPLWPVVNGLASGVGPDSVRLVGLVNVSGHERALVRRGEGNFELRDSNSEVRRVWSLQAQRHWLAATVWKASVAEILMLAVSNREEQTHQVGALPLFLVGIPIKSLTP